MPEESTTVTQVTDSESHTGRWILLLLAVIYVAGSLYFIFALRGEIDHLSKLQTANKVQIGELTQRLQATEAETETLGQQIGMTKKELAQRAAQLQAQTRATEQRLAEQQKQQISQVSGEVAGVKTD